MLTPHQFSVHCLNYKNLHSHVNGNRRKQTMIDENPSPDIPCVQCATPGSDRPAVEGTDDCEHHQASGAASPASHQYKYNKIGIVFWWLTFSLGFVGLVLLLLMLFSIVRCSGGYCDYGYLLVGWLTIIFLPISSYPIPFAYIYIREAPSSLERDRWKRRLWLSAIPFAVFGIFFIIGLMRIFGKIISDSRYY